MCATRRILAVDDDPKIRLLLAAILEDEGYTVELAEHGADALERLDPTPCVILLDLRMPVLDGPGFVRAYWERPGPHAQIIVMSSETRGQEFAAHVHADYLRKPFDLDTLIDLVEDHVRGHDS